MQLSKHFSRAEFERSSTADRLGINNQMPSDLIPNAKFVCETILEKIRAHYGIPFRPNSGFRCAELNTAIGSKTTSQHALAQAVDCEIAGIDNYGLAIFVRENLDFDQLILEFYKPGIPTSGWVHISATPQRQHRGEVLTIEPNGIVSPGLPSL